MGVTGVDALTGAGSGASPRAVTSSIGGNAFDGPGKADDCVVDGKDAGAEAKERWDWTCGLGMATLSANAVIPRCLAIAEAKRR